MRTKKQPFCKRATDSRIYRAIIPMEVVSLSPDS